LPMMRASPPRRYSSGGYRGGSGHQHRNFEPIRMISGRPDYDQIARMTSLKVDNLSEYASENDLINKFADFGKIGDVFIPPGRQYSRNEPSFAFVRFYHSRDAYDAMDSLNGRNFRGHHMRITVAKPRHSRGGQPSSRDRSPYGSRGGRYRSRSPVRRRRFSKSPPRRRYSRSPVRSRSRSQVRRDNYRDRSSSSEVSRSASAKASHKRSSRRRSSSSERCSKNSVRSHSTSIEYAERQHSSHSPGASPQKSLKNESENAPKVENNSPILKNDDNKNLDPLGERLNASDDPETKKEENGLNGDKVEDIFAE